MSLQRAFGGFLWLAAGLASAQAADGAVTAPESVWLGHFSGGRNLSPGAEPIALDWVDVRQLFGSLRECESWVKGFERDYSTYEGYKTCALIR